MLSRILTNEAVLPSEDYDSEAALLMGAQMALKQEREDLARLAVRRALGVRRNRALERNQELLKEMATVASNLFCFSQLPRRLANAFELLEVLPDQVRLQRCCSLFRIHAGVLDSTTTLHLLLQFL